MQLLSDIFLRQEGITRINSYNLGFHVLTVVVVVSSSSSSSSSCYCCEIVKLFIVKVVSNFYLSQLLNTRNSIKQDVNGVSLVSTVAFSAAVYV